MPDAAPTAMAAPSTATGAADPDSAAGRPVSTLVPPDCIKPLKDHPLDSAQLDSNPLADGSLDGRSPALTCAACSSAEDSGDPDQPPVHESVPLATQFLSRELIPAIVDDDVDPALDPRWAESGARDRAEYGYWAARTCGIACLQMVLGHYGLPVPPLVTLARQALAAGCYEPRPDGSLNGLLYRPFVGFVAERFGLRAQVETELDRERLAELAGSGALVMVSVHSSIRRPWRVAPERGGHLVLVTGIDDDGVHLRNPSGHDAAARAAVLRWLDFEPFFAGRGVALWAPTTAG